MASMTLEKALEHLETYGADEVRWPKSLRAGIPGMMNEQEFASRWEEIKAWDDELSGWDLNDDAPDEDSVNVPSDGQNNSVDAGGDGERKNGSGKGGDAGDEAPSDEVDPSWQDADDDDEGGFDLEGYDDDGDEAQEPDPTRVPDLEDLADAEADRPESPPRPQQGETDADQPPQATFGGEDQAEDQPEDQQEDDSRPSPEPMNDGFTPPKSANSEPEDEEEPEPLDIDLEEVRDLDEALSDVIENMMHGAFDSTVQTDFTRDFDKIAPYPSDGDYNVGKFEDRVRKLTGVMQKDLQRQLVARSKSYHVGGFRSGKMNSPALHRVATGDDRIFRRRVVQQTMATAVTLLVDCSGSMASQINYTSTRAPTKIKVAMEAAFAFADILDRLKIPNEVIGFTTGDFNGDWSQITEIQAEVEKMRQSTGLPHGTIRWVPTYMPIFKSFGERFGPEQKKRMLRIVETEEGMGANNDAMALEYAGHRLLMRTEARKIMLVFSDGQPTDGAVTPDVIGATMSRNIKRLESSGVETIGIGIADTSVKRYYPKSMVINDVAQLPTVVMKELRRLLAA